MKSFRELTTFLRGMAMLIAMPVCLYAMAVNRPFDRLGWYLLSLALIGWPEKRDE